MRANRTARRFPLVAGMAAMAIVLAGGLWVLLDENGTPLEEASGTVGTLAATTEDTRGPLTPVDVAPAPAQAETTPINVPAPEIMPPLEVELVQAAPGEPVGSIRGRTLTADGRPVQDTHITLQVGNPMISGSFPGIRRRVDVTARTDAKGSFILSNVPVGKAYVVVAEHESWAHTELSGVRVRKDKTTTGVVLYMQSGAVIRGTVRVKDGPPIGEARVELYNTVELAFRPPEDHRPWKVVFTDLAGKYEFVHVSGSSFRVRVEAPGYESISRVLSFALEARARDQTLDFELNPGVSMTGRVVDVGGNPIGDARIEAHSLTKEFQSSSVAVSDGAGRFLLEGMGDHQYQIRAQATGFTDYRRPKIHPSEGHIEITLFTRGAVEGWVTTLQGRPVQRFELHLMRAQGRRTPSYLNDRRAFKDAGGHFEFDNLDPGGYVLEARASGFADIRSEPFTISRDTAGLAPLRIQMGAGGTLHGTVLFADGKPAPGATVKVNVNNHIDSAVSRLFSQLGPTFERKRSARTDKSGQYSIRNIPPGEYQVAAQHSDAAPAIVNDIQIVDDEAGGNRPFDIQLPAGAVVAGRAIDSDTNPLPFTKVQISQKGTGFVEADTTDKDGHWRFTNLREGNYTLRVNPERLKNERINPFMQMVYAQRSQLEVYLGEGQVMEDTVLVLRKN